MTAEVELYHSRPAEVAIAGRAIDDWIPVLSQVVDLAGQIANSPFVPEGLRGSVPAVAAAILTARELGVPPMTGLANIHLIKGKTGLSALLMRALIMSHGHEWQDVDVSDVRVVVRGRRRGETEWTEASFTAVQAKIAGIQLGGYPQDKLYARASVRLARRKFADVIAGMPYSSEELEDDPGAMLADESYSTPAPPAALAAPAPPRTVRRRQPADAKPGPTPADTAAGAPPAAGPAATPAAPAGSSPDLPPLPGEGTSPEVPEEEAADKDAPGSVTADQIRAVWSIFSAQLGFTKDEKADARAACEKIIGRKLTGGTTGNLSQNEASMVMDTLNRYGTRDRLLVLMNTGELPAGDDDQGEADGSDA